MLPLPNFEAFEKIPRLSRECVVTEKLDGTNAQILITEDQILAGSRSVWLTPAQDNHGFAQWVWAHRDELIAELGIGRHYGEWWGYKINRGYGMKEKVFSLFNTKRWKDAPLKLCKIVPILYEGLFDTIMIENCLHSLRVTGSIAAPGFMNPEGIVIFHKAGNYFFKKTLEKDDEPKGQSIA